MWICISLMRIRILDRHCETNGSGSDLKSRRKTLNVFFRIKIIMLLKTIYYALYELIIHVRYKMCNFFYYKYDILVIFVDFYAMILAAFWLSRSGPGSTSLSFWIIVLRASCIIHYYLLIFLELPLNTFVMSIFMKFYHSSRVFEMYSR